MTKDLKKKVLVRIVDDDEDIRQAMSFMLQCRGWQVRHFSSAKEFLTQDSPSVPGCLLLDIRMPEMSGVELQQFMNMQRMELPIIFITGHADVDTAVQTLKAGALDFLQKPVNAAELDESIVEACRLSLARALGRLTAQQVSDVFYEMSSREKEITRMLVSGLSNREIAERFGLSERTVQGHRNNIYRKLRVHCKTELLEVVRGADMALLET